MYKGLLVTSLLLILASAGCQGASTNSSLPTNPSSSTKTISELVGSKDAVVTRQGSFADAERPTTGTVEIVQAGNKYYVVLGEEFQTSKGPDLQVVLHQSSDLIPELSPPTYSLQESSYVVLGGLKAFKGQQTYPVLTDINLDNFGSVAIWCKKFNATFGAANLR